MMPNAALPLKLVSVNGRRRAALVGCRFDRWLVVRYEGNRRWLCRCDCGNERVVFAGNLNRGSKSCGCHRSETSTALSTVRRKNLAGRRFGRLLVLRFEKTDGRKAYWLCRCDCGKEKAIAAGNLMCGGTKSCGCHRRGPFVDRMGQRYGRLTVIGFAGVERSKACRHAKWIVRCDCGNEKTVLGHALHSGNTQSCGCLWLDHQHSRRGKAITHGYTVNGKKTPEYQSWHAMLGRCRDLKNVRYGGRGIKVCERWNSFENFLADMGPRPEKTSIHRLDEDGDYELSNCVWATSREQAKYKARIFMSLKPTLPPETPDGRHCVTLESDYGSMSSKFANLARAQTQAEQWRTEFPAAKITIELA